MTKDEIRFIVQDVIDELRNLPDGYETTSGRLLFSIGHDLSDMPESELLEYHQQLFKMAEVNHIVLDISKHYGLFQGLPWNLDFVVRNSKAQVICPKCGSKSTARIIYGLPELSEELIKEINRKKIRLGGCNILNGKLRDGTIVSLSPKYYCNECGKSFGKPPYIETNDYVEYIPDIVKSVRFKYSSWMRPKEHYNVLLEYDGKEVSVNVNGGNKIDNAISQQEWFQVLNRLYYRFYIQDWDSNYGEPAEDGVEWEFEVVLQADRKMTYSGYMDFPSCKEEFKDLFDGFRKLKSPEHEKFMQEMLSKLQLD